MSNPTTFSSYMARQIALLKAAGRFRTAETYKVTLKRFSDFLEGREIRFSEITPRLVGEFEGYLLARHNCRNTTSFYMRILRAVYNRGADMSGLRLRDPFRNVYTGVDKTRKRAVPVSVIRCLKALDLKDEPRLAKARDIFLFSFFTRGMSFIDMAFLRRRDLQGNVLCYTRRKTGQTLCISWEPAMQEIVDRYPPNPNGFLLPIITKQGRDFHKQYKSAIQKTNEALSRISLLLHLDILLTSYVARHSWASIAYNHNVPLAVISEGLGHDSERTTRIYLDSVSNAVVDRANRKIINMLS